KNGGFIPEKPSREKFESFLEHKKRNMPGFEPASIDTDNLFTISEQDQGRYVTRAYYNQNPHTGEIYDGDTISISTFPDRQDEIYSLHIAREGNPYIQNDPENYLTRTKEQNESFTVHLDWGSRTEKSSPRIVLQHGDYRAVLNYINNEIFYINLNI